MKKCFLLILTFYFSITLKAQIAGDYIITWKNDTIACSFPDNPKDADIRPARKYLNGHVQLVTVFPNDSIRIIQAGDIKAYFRKNHGKSLLCNGYFESKKISIWGDVKKNPDGRTNEEWYFFQRLVEGKYASLHIVYLGNGDDTWSIFYVTKHDGEKQSMTRVSGWKKTIALLADNDTAEELNKIKNKGKSKYSHLVNEYNRLKEASISVTGSDN